MRVGVIGCGYWGPNHIRNFLALEHMDVEVAAAADRDPERRKHVQQLFPSLELVEDGRIIIEDESIDAVVIATPVSSHYPLARAALLAGKDVLVEKPLTADTRESAELVAIADRLGRTLMVGHTYEYAAAVNHIRHVIEDGELGSILYVRSLRVNLGIVQPDVSVLWDLAPHDVSILRYVLQRPVTEVSAVGTAHYSKGLADVVSLNLEFGSQLSANIICSWLDPRKVREMTIVGSKKMLVYDDISANEKVRIYDRGVDGPSRYDNFGDFQYSYRYGDIISPHIEEWEPLREECSHFIECVRTGKTPRSGGESGAEVVRILAAAERSLRLHGERVSVEPAEGGMPAAKIDLTGSPGRDSVASSRGVLVVGSDERMLGLVSRALDAFSPGHEVVTALDCPSAARWLEVFQPDVVILEDQVAGSARACLGSLPGVRLIVVGEGSDLGPEQAIHLPKPLQLPHLLAALASSPV